MSHVNVPVGALVRALTVVENAVRQLNVKPTTPAYARMRGVRWMQLHALGTAAVMAFGVVFFWPILTQIASYTPGGDAMFNAWTLGRLHYCLTGQGCPNFVDGNIFFPNHFSMVYSETQLSAGVLTLPLFWINANPIFSYNVWTILSYVFSSWFMYFLAMHVSRNIRWVSIAAGLMFAYAPIKIVAVEHLQNLSIFYLPLAVLFMMKYLRSRRWRFLVYLFITLVLFFYASWYQMVFGLIAIGVFLVGVAVFRLGLFRSVLWLGSVVGLAVLSTWPLAAQYLAFSKLSGAKYDVSEQALYSARLVDYVLPYKGTVLGSLLRQLFPAMRATSYNPDSASYHGIVLCLLALTAVVIACVIHKRSQWLQRTWRWALVFGGIAIAGFLASLGPYLQWNDHPAIRDGHPVAMPWFFLTQFLPQLDFIRSIGRASILVLFALCVLLAALPAMLRVLAPLRQDRRRQEREVEPGEAHSHYRLRGGRARWVLPALVVAAMCIETLPFGLVPTNAAPSAHNVNVPTVYQLIRTDPQIDDLVVIYADREYSDTTAEVAKVEPVLWAGYHNKNIFNGYSGYVPPGYQQDMDKFNAWTDDPVGRMRRFGLRYVLVDLRLSQSRPDLAQVVEESGLTLVYQDPRYALFTLAT